MTSVSNIQSSMSGVNANSARAGIFNSSVSKQNQWSGKQQYIGSTARTAAVQTTAERAPALQTSAPSGSMRKFLGTNNAYFPQVDYYQFHRETALFESIRDRGGFSPNRRRDSAF